MKKIFTVLAITLFFSANAQFMALAKSSGSNTNDMLGVIGTDNNSFYVLKKTGEKLMAERYNKKSLTKEWDVEIPCPKKTEFCWLNSGYLGGIKNNQLWVFIPTVRSNNFVLLLQTISTDGKLNGESKEFSIDVDKHQAGNWNQFFKYQHQKIFRWSLSPDSSKAVLWVYAFNSESFINEKNTTRGAVFDIKNLSLISDKLPQKYNDSYMTVKSFAISNEGKLTCSFTYEGKDGTHNLIGLYGKSAYNGNPEKIIPSTLTTFFDDCSMTFLKNGKLFFSAFYTDKDKNNSAMYVMQYDITSAKTDFETTQFMSDEWGKKYKPNKGKGSHMSTEMGTGRSQAVLSSRSTYKFYFNFINNGGCIISALKMDGGNRKGALHYSDDAIVAKITPVGKTEWIKTVPICVGAREAVKNKDGLIYYMNCTYSNNKMYYVFDNDMADEKDIDLSKVDASKETEMVTDFYGKNINTSCISIDMTGNLQRTVICTNKDKGFSPFPNTVLIDKNKMLMHFISDKEDSFSVFTLQ